MYIYVYIYIYIYIHIYIHIYIFQLELDVEDFQDGALPTTHEHAVPRQALRTSIRSQFLKILIAFGDKCPRNGSKNEETAPITRTG